jgi:hypothetical protein
MFRPFCGWVIIRLRLEYRRKLLYCNVDIKNGGTRSRFTMFGEVRSYTGCLKTCHKLFPGYSPTPLKQNSSYQHGSKVNRFRDIDCCVEIREML